MAFLDDKSATGLLQRRFAAQFADENGQLVYRANGTGPAIPVSMTEFNDFSADFDYYVALGGTRTRLKWLIPAMLISLAFAYLIVQMSEAGHVTGRLIIYIPLAAASSILRYRAWKVPELALAQRPPFAPALPKDVARRKRLRELSWLALALWPIVVGALAWLVRSIPSTSALEYGFWLVMAGGTIIGCTVQAVRKWRAEQVDVVEA